MNRFFYIALFTATMASAKLPEPALTLMGGLFQNVEVNGIQQIQSIIPSNNEKFEIVAMRDGVGVVAIATIDASRGDNLVLMRVPRDDGAEPRAEAHFSRTGETVRFEVWYYQQQNLSAIQEPTRKFATIMEGDYTLQSGMGGVIPRSFTIHIPAGETPFSNSGSTYEAWVASITWPAGWDTNPDADPDNDGIGNFQEWVLDLDPTARDGFEVAAPIKVTDTNPVMDTYRVKMRPTRVGRTYHIYRLMNRVTILPDDMPIFSYMPDVDSDDWYQYIDTEVDTTQSQSVFYRVAIEINN